MNMIDEDTKKLINLKERFNQESKAITSQITFVEDSIILPSIKNKNNKYIDFVDKLPTTISNIQQQLSDTIAKLDSKLTELKSSLDHLQYRNISDKLFNIDIRSVEGECINHILDIIDEGENDRLKIAKIVQVDL